MSRLLQSFLVKFVILRAGLSRYFMYENKSYLLSWVLTPRLEKALEEFHRWAARWMAYMVPKIQPDGTWLYPPIGSALSMIGLEDIWVYITCI